MQQSKKVSKFIHFTDSDGFVSQTIKQQNWDITSIGQPSSWEQSLKTSLNILETAAFPAFLTWGDDRLGFFNESLRSLFVHTSDVWDRAGEDAELYFTHNWPVLWPSIQEVLQTGVSLFKKKQIFWIEKNAEKYSCSFTINYSAVRNNAGIFNGVLLTFIEVGKQEKIQENTEGTDKVIQQPTEPNFTDNKNYFRETIKQTPFAICILLGPDYITEIANETYLKIIDRNEAEVIGKPLLTLLPEVRDSVKELLDKVYSTGIPFHGKEMGIPLIKNGVENIHFFDFTYYPLREPDGSISGIICTGAEITEQVISRKKLEESEFAFKNLISQMPSAMLVANGSNHIVEFVNKSMLSRWNKTEEEVIGKPILEVFPELNDSPFMVYLNEVYQTGKHHSGIETETYQYNNTNKKKLSYIDYEYAPVHDIMGNVSGIMVIVNDVTEKITTRKDIEESELRYHNLIHSSPTAIGILQGKEMIITIANDAIIDILGKGKEIIGKSYFDVLPELATQGYKEIFENVYDTGLPFSAIETPLNIIRDNLETTRYYDLLLFPQKEINGTITGIGIIASEVTSQAILNNEVKESEQRFIAAISAVKGVVWTNNTHGEMNGVQEGWETLTGQSMEEYQGFGWAKVIHPEDAQPTIDAWNKAVETLNVFNFEHRVFVKEGEYRMFAVKATPIFNTDGTVKQWVGVHTDIQKRIEEEQQKDYFISMASHELKTPVTSLKGYVQILMEMYKSTSDPILQNSLKVMDRQTATLIKLITELLDVSKIKLGELEFEKSNVNIIKLVQEVVKEMEHINPGYNISFSYDKEVMVLADYHRISQVLINLITNAVKYAPDSNIIEVKSFIQENILYISVKDKGIGILETDHRKIFERFYRVEGKNEKTYPGFGIGLFISEEIIKKHKGTILVDSKPGQGSTFTISIPIIQTH